MAVNPFENLPIYSNAEMKRAAGAMNLYPHVYVTANVAFSQLKTNLKNQSVLISGESVRALNVFCDILLICHEGRRENRNNEKSS